MALAGITVSLVLFTVGWSLAAGSRRPSRVEADEARSDEIVDTSSSTSGTGQMGNLKAGETSNSVVGNDAAAQELQTPVGSTVPVEDPWVKGGLFTTGDTELDNYVKELCDAQSDLSASAADNAFDTYNFVTNTTYEERVNNQSPWGETWDVEYATQYFEEGRSGNCYNFAAVIEYVLKYFGYSDAEAEPCVVKLSSDDWGDHGLVFVTNIVDGEACLVDAARYKEGWMLGKDAYTYDIRNVAQNPTIVGNADVIFDSDHPIPITPAPGLEPPDSE